MATKYSNIFELTIHFSYKILIIQLLIVELIRIDVRQYLKYKIRTRIYTNNKRGKVQYGA